MRAAAREEIDRVFRLGLSYERRTVDITYAMLVKRRTQGRKLVGLASL